MTPYSATLKAKWFSAHDALFSYTQSQMI